GGARYDQVLVSDGQVVRDVFDRQAAEIFVFFDLEDAPAATPLKAIWGERFLVQRVDPEAVSPPVTVVTNWHRLLE
ncbi:MAG TPA: hypothetical protein VMS86_15190, partial [Thermoanaerobaculia bacterium]|nr:hypothetical protein [Thermoanaerobaculia bacterium]